MYMQFFRFLFTTGKKIFSILVEYISSTMKNKKMCRKEERNRGREGEGVRIVHQWEQDNIFMILVQNLKLKQQLYRMKKWKYKPTIKEREHENDGTAKNLPWSYFSWKIKNQHNWDLNNGHVTEARYLRWQSRRF